MVQLIECLLMCTKTLASTPALYKMAVVVRAFNSSTQEAEGRRIRSTRPLCIGSLRPARDT